MFLISIQLLPLAFSKFVHSDCIFWKVSGACTCNLFGGVLHAGDRATARVNKNGENGKSETSALIRSPAKTEGHCGSKVVRRLRVKRKEMRGQKWEIEQGINQLNSFYRKVRLYLLFVKISYLILRFFADRIRRTDCRSRDGSAIQYE